MADYRWIVMMLAFLVNFLLLLGTNRLCGSPPDGLRAALAAALGALHAGLCLTSRLYFLGTPFWRLVWIVLMALVAFGMQRSALQRGLLFGLLEMAMEGITTGGGWSVIFGAVVIFLLCFADGRRPAFRYVPVTITYGKNTLSLMAMPDNGNTLRDPVSGAPVVIVGTDAAHKLLGLTELQLLHPIETLSSGSWPRLRLIPYCAIGQPAGMLLGLKVDQLLIDGKRSNAIVAFAPQRIGQGSTFQALTGGIA